MAIKILSLTSSSSGCERNWSTFEGIHTKKRNRLASDRLNDLVYVQFNSKLATKRGGRSKRGNKKQDVLLASPGDVSTSMHWKDDMVIERDNEDQEEAFPGSELTWRQVAEASGADEVLENRRSQRTLRRHSSRGKGVASSMASLDVHEQNDFPSGDDTDEELHVQEGLDQSSEEEEDNTRYEDDDE